MIRKQHSKFVDYLRHSLARQLLGVILIATGTGKALDIPGFVQVLSNYQLLPYWGNVAMAYTLPFIELATGVGLLTAKGLIPGAYSAVVLHMLFLSTASITQWRGIHLDNCGCFGVFLARPLSIQTLIEDGLLLLLSLYILIDSLYFRE